MTFADGLFEVIRTIENKILFFEDHFRGCKERRSLRYHSPYGSGYVKNAALELIKNGIEDGELYLELTRGTDLHRDTDFPLKNTFHFLHAGTTLRHIDRELEEGR